MSKPRNWNIVAWQDPKSGSAGLIDVSSAEDSKPLEGVTGMTFKRRPKG